jgi:lipopolysaccharide/colanic/teichoic acid biosynthesis glycosyltransferase
VGAVYRGGLKRLFDCSVSVASLAILSPLLLAVCVAIKRGSPGPVLYRGPRVGLAGRPFSMLKFRTMIVDADRQGPSSTAADDARITRIGAWLRRYKLDELPQLVNVVRGEMSLVGPRPQVSWAVAEYSPEEKRVLTVRPGITDWASIRFRNEADILKGSDDPDRDYMLYIHPEKMALSLEYVDNVSFATDLTILMRTAGLVLGVGSSQQP